MNDENKNVKRTSIWAFGSICQICSDSISNKDILQPIV